jgi:hypothetical protein
MEMQRKVLQEKGEEVPSQAVKLMLEELIAGRVEPLPMRCIKRRRSESVHFGLWWNSFGMPKDWRLTCVCSHCS